MSSTASVQATLSGTHEAEVTARLKASVMAMVQEDLQRLYTDLDRSIGDRVSLATRNVSSDHTAQQQELGELRVRHQASDGARWLL